MPSCQLSNIFNSCIGIFSILIKIVIRESTPGSLQEPFQIGNSWLILRLEEKRLAKLDSSMKKRMAFELFQLYMEEEINKALESSKQLIFK